MVARGTRNRSSSRARRGPARPTSPGNWPETLAGSKDRVTLVQSHPSYAYEDFVQGYRPAESARERLDSP